MLPKAEARRCARHIYSKWRKGRDGEMYNALYWSAVKSTCVPELKENLVRMYNYDPAALKAIMEVAPKFWCKAYFEEHSKTDVTDNNMCETFNANIMEARHKSIVAMFEEIRIYVMNRFRERRKFGRFKFVGKFGPTVWSKIQDFNDLSTQCYVETNGTGGWEVFERGMKFLVQYEQKTCSCRVWDLTGIPCQHAV